jgi:hypothetical protein
LHFDESLCYIQERTGASSSVDRASDYGSEGRGFESLLAHIKMPMGDVDVILHHPCFLESWNSSEAFAGNQVQTYWKLLVE